MYGAILIPETELTKTGEADIGVLFCHNEGYSTMCGHATIALGRFLVDTQDEILFPRCKEVQKRADGQTIKLNLHAPCGLVKITVPIRYDVTTTAGDGNAVERIRADFTKSVNFLSVPSFAVCVGLELEIPMSSQWPEILNARGGKPTVTLDIAYGGAFYAIVRADDLGFQGARGRVVYDKETLRALDYATAQVKALLQERIEVLLAPVAHLVEKDIRFLYGVTVVDSAGPQEESKLNGAKGTDRNLCFFSNQQLDRSPTGSCVSARIALDITKKKIGLGDRWIFHSIVSDIRTRDHEEAFVGSAVYAKRQRLSDIPKGGIGSDTYVVQVEGKAWYVGTENFVLEEKDHIGKGFLIDAM